MKIVSPIGAKTNQTQAIPSFELSEDGKVTQDTARSYVALLKNTVTASEFILFKGAMKAYKQEYHPSEVNFFVSTSNAMLKLIPRDIFNAILCTSCWATTKL